MATNLKITPLGDLIPQFLQHRKVNQALATSTLDNDKTVLQQLLYFCGGTLQIRKLDARKVDEFLAYRAASGISQGYMNIHINVLKQFFSWCDRWNYLPASESPMRGVVQKDYIPKRKQRISVTQFSDLLDVAEARHPQHRIVVAMGLLTMMRRNEIRDLRVGHWLPAERELLAARTKTKENAVMAVDSVLAEEITRWLRFYGRTLGYRPHPHAYLIPAKRKPRGTRNERGQFQYVPGDAHLLPDTPVGQMERIVRWSMEDLGLETRDSEGASLFEGMHTLRRSGARALYDQLVSEGRADALRLVQTELGHKHQSQTEEYIGISLDQKTLHDRVKAAPLFPQMVANSGTVRRIESIERKVQ